MHAPYIADILSRVLIKFCCPMPLQIAYLEELGIPSQLVCNMASMSPKILGQDVEQLQSVVAFLKEQGLNGTMPTSCWALLAC